MCRKIRIVEYLLLVLLLMGVVVGCVGIENGGEVDRTERLRERVSDFLEARNNSKLTEMRKFYKEPGQARLGNVMIRDGKIEALEITKSERRARVKLKANMQAMGFTFKNVPQTQEWVWDNGDWYIDSVGAAQSNPFRSKKVPKVENENSKK